MGNLSNRAIHEVFGCPTEIETEKVSFTSSATYQTLEANSVYRLAATEDCFITFKQNVGDSVTTSGVLIFGGVPEMFSTTGKMVKLGVLRVSADGDLHVTKMITRGN